MIYKHFPVEGNYHRYEKFDTGCSYYWEYQTKYSKLLEERPTLMQDVSNITCEFVGIKFGWILIGKFILEVTNNLYGKATRDIRELKLSYWRGYLLWWRETSARNRLDKEEIIKGLTNSLEIIKAEMEEKKQLKMLK